MLLQTAPRSFWGLPPQITQQLLAIAVKLKNIGTYGDEIADLLAPPDPNNLAPQAKAILAQSQGQIHLLTQEVQKLQLEKLGKVTEYQGKQQLAAMDHFTAMSEADKDRETKIAVAEISTKAQILSERVEAVETTDDAIPSASPATYPYRKTISAGTREGPVGSNRQRRPSAQSSQEHGQAQEQQVTAAALQPEPKKPGGKSMIQDEQKVAETS